MSISSHQKQVKVTLIKAGLVMMLLFALAATLYLASSPATLQSKAVQANLSAQELYCFYFQSPTECEEAIIPKDTKQKCKWLGLNTGCWPSTTTSYKANSHGLKAAKAYCQNISFDDALRDCEARAYGKTDGRFDCFWDDQANDCLPRNSTQMY